MSVFEQLLTFPSPNRQAQQQRTDNKLGEGLVRSCSDSTAIDPQGVSQESNSHWLWTSYAYVSVLFMDFYTLKLLCKE